jgi:hypothetical protein
MANFKVVSLGKSINKNVIYSLKSSACIGTMNSGQVGIVAQGAKLSPTTVAVDSERFWPRQIANVNTA